jgi:hypothetical protein
MPTVITKEERRLVEGHHLRNWMKGKDYKAKESLYFSILQTMEAMIATSDGECDPRVLAELLALTIGGDATFRGWVEKRNRNSTRLQTPDGWRELYNAAAALVVEHHLKHQQAPDQPGTDDLDSPSAITRSELTDRVKGLIALATTGASEAQALLAGQPGVVSYTPPAALTPELTDGLQERLTAALEKELVIVTPLGEDLGIPEQERDREVAKRALIRLKTSALRDVAREAGVPETGSLEHVAERIAAKHQDDEAQIAELVLRHEEEIPERGHVSRLVKLHEPPNLQHAATLLRPLLQNYVRIGVARWFVFTDVTHTPEQLRIAGTYRYFHVTPKVEYEQYSIAAKPQEADVQILLRRNVGWIEIQSRVAADTRALSIALQHTAGIRPRETLPIELTIPDGDMYTFARRTVFMLALLSVELSDQHIRTLNMKLAHFEQRGNEETPNPRKPTVRSVRIGGQHLLSSRQACELITAGQALLSFNAIIAATLQPGERVACPIRVDLADDHASVFTGFTSTTGEQETRRVHDELVARIRKALEREDVPVPTLALVPQIIDRAKGEDPDVADIAPPPDEPTTVTAEGGSAGDGRAATGGLPAGSA